MINTFQFANRQELEGRKQYVLRFINGESYYYKTESSINFTSLMQYITELETTVKALEDKINLLTNYHNPNLKV